MAGQLASMSAFVTGAGQGIGRAICLAFAAEGARVVAASRTAAKMADLPEHGDIEPVPLDLADPDAITAVVAAAGRIDILINCAGMVANGTVLDCDEATWAESFDTNVTAAFRTIRAALPGMVERGDGRIVNVASVASSVTGVANRFAYGASKAAMIGLTKSVARDFIRDGIRCNALCPGTTLSPSLEARIAAAPDPAEMRRTFVERQPMGRLGAPEELANGALFLASDASRFMTGQLLVIDGGQTL
ncbi:SDR family oxidoreductase [Acuticoccus sp. M5D2P5]|uniref:SDR family oxidoreductase n=1 Tax=Acuticoccus kalidii TaxID=2910977 RepID=UPI001F242CA0|nr:SDR family oxidoreductase [Acuticoccus kalidii]MCF3933707.1 SDR family oxidoreductase [Acuticoccus kalidii]